MACAVQGRSRRSIAWCRSPMAPSPALATATSCVIVRTASAGDGSSWRRRPGSRSSVTPSCAGSAPRAQSPCSTPPGTTSRCSPGPPTASSPTCASASAAPSTPRRTASTSRRPASARRPASSRPPRSATPSCRCSTPTSWWPGGPTRSCARRGWRQWSAGSSSRATPSGSRSWSGVRAISRARWSPGSGVPSSRPRRPPSSLRQQSLLQQRSLARSSSLRGDGELLLGEGPVDPLEVLEAGEVDRNAPPARRVHRDLHPRLEVITQELLELGDPSWALTPAPRCGRAGGDGRGRLGGVVVLPYGLLDRPDREILLGGLASQLLLEGAVGGAEQGSRVAHLELLVAHHLLDRRWECEEAEGVAHRGPAAAGPGRDLLVGEAEVLDELLVGAGLLERVQLLALEVLDQRLLEGRAVVGLAHERGNGLEPDPAGGPPAALPRDHLVAVAHGPDQHRLEHTHLADRVGQRAEALLVELVSRLESIGLDRGDGDLLEPRTAFGAGRRTRLCRSRRDQGAEPLTQPARSRHGSPPWPDRGTPWRRATSNRTR